VVLSL
jgi:hypothetical protein